MLVPTFSLLPRPNCISVTWVTFLPCVPVQLNVEMVAASARIEQRHAWESFWWEWPLNMRGILYYSKEVGHTYTATVYLLGNPLVIWLVLVFIAANLGMLLFYWRYRTDALFAWDTRHALRRFFPTTLYCLLVYIANLMPYVAVKRSCFIYHYMPALMYGEILAGLTLDELVPAKWRPYATKLLILVMAAGFVIYAPWIYAFRTSYSLPMCTPTESLCLIRSGCALQLLHRKDMHAAVGCLGGTNCALYLFYEGVLSQSNFKCVSLLSVILISEIALGFHRCTHDAAGRIRCRIIARHSGEVGLDTRRWQ